MRNVVLKYSCSNSLEGEPAMTLFYEASRGDFAVSLSAAPLGEKDWCLAFSGVGGAMASVCFPGGEKSFIAEAGTSLAEIPAQLLKTHGIDCVVCVGLLPNGKSQRDLAAELCYELTGRFLNDIKGR